MPIDVNELLAPIPGSDPAGSDASFSDQFDRIREARRADDPLLAQGEWKTELKVADWREAQSLAEDILLDLAAQDIPAIPVHDSFIVPLSKGPELVAAMHRAKAGAKRIIKQNPKVYSLLQRLRSGKTEFIRTDEAD